MSAGGPSERWAARALAIGAIVVLLALGFITWSVLRLESREAEARQASDQQESLRLALWRIDSVMTPILAREAARPYFEYQPFIPADRAYTNFFSEVSESEVLVPSPLLTASDPLVNLYFQKMPDGSLESPQAPMGPAKGTAEAAYLTPYAAETNQTLLTDLSVLLARHEEEARKQVVGAAMDVGTLAEQGFGRDAEVRGREPNEMAQQQIGRGAPEGDYQARAAVSKQAQEITRLNSNRASVPMSVEAERADADKRYGDRSAKQRGESQDGLAAKTAASGPAASMPMAGSTGVPAERASEQNKSEVAARTSDDVVVGDFQAMWVGVGSEPPKSELVFRRTVRVGGREIEQGLWMNWEQLQGRLLRPVADIYPDARLRPVTENVSNVPSRTLARMLASIPAELVMTAAAPAPGPAWTPLRSALLATWVVVVLALAGLALAMRSMAELAARRGQFVSAVTHELRTPLTTFRLYSQMLASGMVREEADRTQYARTLFGESERLGRIVESVLEYARLGKGEKPRREALKLAELRDRLGPVLQGAANEHGAEIVDTLGDGEEATVRVDPSRIERILVNLVDNAGKYGKRDGEPARVEVLWSADAQSGMLRVSVRDHGPGIPAAEARRVFRPFTRGAMHAHGSTPGMGLGLALARGLAEQCGGSVTYEPREGEEGARFVLRTPGT